MTWHEDVETALVKKGAVYVTGDAAGLIVLWPAPFIWGAAMMRVPTVWFVLCKRYGKLPKPERTTLLHLADMTGALPVLARESGRGVEFVNLNTKEIIDV